jgi:DNA polymerase-3 subunit delta
MELRDLASHLSRMLAPAYLLAGEEPLLLQEAADTLRAQAREKGFSEREVLYVESGFDWQRLHATGDNRSLFAERRLIEVHLGGAGPGVEGAAALVEFLEAQPADVMLVLHAGRLDKRARNSAWYQAFETKGQALYVWPIAMEKLPAWVAGRLARAGLKAEAGAVEALVARTEGNLLACAQEIEKLRLLYPDGMLDETRVKEAVADSARYDIDDLLNRALSGDAAGAIQSLRRLQEEGEAAPLATGALAHSLRSLYTVVDLAARGTPMERALAEAGVWASRKDAVRRAAQRLGAAEVLEFIREVAFADRVAKGAAEDEIKDEIWEELVKLTARIAGVPLATGLPAIRVT